MKSQQGPEDGANPPNKLSGVKAMVLSSKSLAPLTTVDGDNNPSSIVNNPNLNNNTILLERVGGVSNLLPNNVHLLKLLPHTTPNKWPKTNPNRLVAVGVGGANQSPVVVRPTLPHPPHSSHPNRPSARTT